MPKKQVSDDEDIIEIEEFTNEKQAKSKPKQKPDKKAKKKELNEQEDESEEEEESEEEDKPKNKGKKKTTKKPISDKRLENLKKGREKAAANRAKKKAEQIDSLKKELWDEFNGKIKQVKEVKESEPTPKATTISPHDIISKMKQPVPENNTTGRIFKSFSKIK